MADHQEQQQHESSAMSHPPQQQQPELSFGLALAARKDSEEECKFDDVMALQEEAIHVRPYMNNCIIIYFSSCCMISISVLTMSLVR